MIKNPEHIEIVRSEIKSLSSMSKESCDAILHVLSKQYARVGVTYINTQEDLEALADKRPDLVFLGMESIPNGDRTIWLSDFLDHCEIAYTGSNKKAHELARDKPLAKQRVLDAKLPTSAFCIIKQNQLLDSSEISLNFPLFIKPTNRGGGLGIDSDSVVHTAEQLRSKIQSITTVLRADALIEEYLPGREFSVAILKDEYSSSYQIMPIELVAPPDKNGSRLLSGSVKSSNTEAALTVTDQHIKSNVSALALAVFYALGAQDYGRVDIRLDATNTPQFLEANLLPSLISGYGSFPKACVLNSGLNYESMILTIVRLGLTRNTSESAAALESFTIKDPHLEVAFEQM